MKSWFSLAGACAFALAGLWYPQPASAEGNWTTLLDASKFSEWGHTGDGNWRVEDGVIVADKKEGKEASYLVSKDDYTDFHIRVEFLASDDANSGIYMRCLDRTKPTDKTCYEANIFDQRPDPTYGTGALVYIAKVDPMPKVGGKWSTYDITVKGSHVTLILNGQKTVDVEDTKLTKGPIAVQYAAGSIKIRKIEIEK
jgi:hypothetical protein